ncbi:hypothetical protein [Wolbachia endosymbiont (group A) of Sphecodes monilicornis]|uniref:hypothetical protein n=1 Tax=Wolbachia endosymbiont (group A) of Sphecodes monilicornis TaxID=2954060 RepID=UPI002227A7C9|nr:hypothetical protein [Wolbachia endosymbiont (group A) of Sphecodes monilicornis]
MEQDKNVTENGKEKLRPLMLEMFNLVSTGTDVSQEVRRLLPEDILKERGEYLSRLKQIVSDSIENDKKKEIVVERDNKFYYVQCPEKSVITPAKFMNSPEFKDLGYGALRIGEGDNLI